MLRKFHILALLAAVVLLGTVSCKKSKDDPDTTTFYSVSTTSTLVGSFKLRGSSTAAVDSTHFTVDVDRGLIYNADSLPVGTDLSHLLTTVSFASTVGSARYLLTYTEDGIVKRDTVTYTSSSTDSLNFTGSVILEVSSYDNSQTRRYQVRVNVHQTEPDTLQWPLTSRRDLPGMAGAGVAQRTVQWGDRVVCLLRTDAGCRLSVADDPDGPWTSEDFAPGFDPDVNSLAASDEDLYLLDSEGYLHVSKDARTWTSAGVRWAAIIGGYADRALGVSADEVPILDEYPRHDGFTVRAVQANFPVAGLSQLVTTRNRWTVAPQAVMVGGVLADGTVSNLSWGYDGSTWAVISSESDTLPALRDAILVSYVTCDVSSSNYQVTQRPAWLLMGGFKADGTANRTTYMSRNQGITWSKAGSGLQWPDHLPSMGQAQALVAYRTLTASKAPRRVSRPVTEWECPYIYLFGGYDTGGALRADVWRGFITRLTFQPLY